MKGFDLTTPGWNREALQNETLRVFEVCDGCRRCFNLCPSFGTLFDRTDHYESDLTRVTGKDFNDVVDRCYYCKLCYNHCPYTPPHPYEIDYPRLMVAWKTLPEKRASQPAMTRLRDRLLSETDVLGRLGSLFHGLVNRALTSRWIRGVLHRVFGIHKDRRILPFQSPTFAERWAQAKNASPSRRSNGNVALFYTCLVNYQCGEIGEATMKVMDKNAIDVVCPEQQCCGMPYFDTGDLASLTKKANANIRAFLPWIDKGYAVVAPVPTCSLMLKREYPYLLRSNDAKRVAENTYDVCEYLMMLYRDGRLATDFERAPGTIAYQVPCHLRDQNIGFKSRDLMRLTGAQVSVTERCSGHDGSWSVKREFFGDSMTIASKVTADIEPGAPDLIASDCPLSALQIAQHLGRPVLHPIQVIQQAYGL